MPHCCSNHQKKDKMKEDKGKNVIEQPGSFFQRWLAKVGASSAEEEQKSHRKKGCC